MCHICVEVSCLQMPLTIYALVCTTSKDATLTLMPTEFTVDEGPDSDLAELCVVISNLADGGLQSVVVTTFILMGGTAGTALCILLLVVSVSLLSLQNSFFVTYSSEELNKR